MKFILFSHKHISSYVILFDSYRLMEMVEDCGPLPIANDKCKLDTEKTNKSAPFPHCCPKFSCEAGAKLEYPDIKAEPEKHH